MEISTSESESKISHLEEKIRQLETGYQSLIEENNYHLKALFNSSNELIQIIGPEGKIKFVNESWRYKLGFTDVELLKLSFFNIVHPSKQEETSKKLSEISTKSPSAHLETILINNHGRNIYASGQVTAVIRDGSVVEYRSVLHDISERVRTESVQKLFFSIAGITQSAHELEKLYERVFKELSSHLKVRNFCIAIKNDDEVGFPFRVNEVDTKNTLIDELMSDYYMSRNKSMIVYEDGLKKVIEQSGLSEKLKLPKIWLGVPVNVKEQNIGVIMLYSYRDHSIFNHKDLELLDFISGQISLAIERKLNQDKITNQAARLRAIFDSSTHQIWSINRSYQYTSFNTVYEKSFKNYFQLNVEVGKDFRTHLQKNESLEYTTWTTKYKEAFKGQIVNFQTSRKGKDGSLSWRDVFLNPIHLPDGRIEEISAIANDITEKKQADLALEESEEKFRNIFESFQDVYFRCDLKGDFTMISPSVKEILGFKTEEVLGRNIGGFLVGKNQTKTLLKTLLESKSLRDFEGKLVTKNNKKVQMLCNLRLVENSDSKATEIEGVARDITQLTKTNRELKSAKNLAEKSLKIKERFLANMSHEIRTPMNGIVGMIDLLASTSLDEEQTDYIRTIKKSSDTLLNILNDILDLSKIEAGKMELKSEPVKLVEIFEKVYDLYSQQASQNQTNLYYHLDEKLPEYVLTDETRLIQVISNLTSNAIKFSNKGTINLSIKVSKFTGSKVEFRIAVKDSGIGIHPNDQKKLFVSFNQVDNSNQKLFAGTGLGLAISKQLVTSMKGDIGVVSTPGFGSTFWFTFTAKKLDEIPKPKMEIDDFEEQFVDIQPKILLVDDNDINRKVATEILKKSGCLVKDEPSGERAIKAIKEDYFDLVFMDIQMPEMDGIEATRQIKKLDLEVLPPIVAMTAYSMEEDRQNFINQGLDDYLAKPIKAKQIIQKVREWTKYTPTIVETKVLEEYAEDLVINQNTLNQLHKYGGRELIESVLADFDKEATSQVFNSIKFLEVRDFEKIRSEMHTLKGNAGTLGVEKLSKQASLVEKRIKENKVNSLRKELQTLESRLTEFKENYHNLLKDE